jgi:hypothetical protein
MRTAKLGLVILLISPPGTALAHQQGQQQEQQTPPPADQQQDSLAAASRRARAEQKDEPKPAKVWDNDSIPTTTGNISVIGQAAAPPDNSPEADNRPVNPAASAEKKSAIEGELTAAKQQLESLKTDLDIMQRKYTLDDSMYRGKPDYTSDKDGAAAMKDEKDQVDAKLQEVVDAQKKIDDLQAQLDAASTEKSK